MLLLASGAAFGVRRHGRSRAHPARRAELCANPSNPKQYTSNLHLREDKNRHRRVDNSPMSYLSKPLTSSQEIGWHTAQATTKEGKKYYPITSTEITTNEGRSIQDYFGDVV